MAVEINIITESTSPKWIVECIDVENNIMGYDIHAFLIDFKQPLVIKQNDVAYSVFANNHLEQIGEKRIYRRIKTINIYVADLHILKMDIKIIKQNNNDIHIYVIDNHSQ